MANRGSCVMPPKAMSGGRLPFFGNKMKIEASVLLGDRDKEVEVHGERDCWDLDVGGSGCP